MLKIIKENIKKSPTVNQTLIHYNDKFLYYIRQW